MDPKTKIRAWARFLKVIRTHFEGRGYTEVTTPHLVDAGAFESTIDPLKVSFSSGKGELHTSPEIEMKRVLAETHQDIFQICQCFRDDPETGRHWREFTMLEFYKMGATYQETQEEMVSLLKELFGKKLPPIHRMSVQEAGLKFAQVDLLEVDSKKDDLFFKVLIEKIEPGLSHNHPTILYDYPASQCALGKTNGKITERFEIYWKGMELCNGCTELTDKNEALERYKTQSSERNTAHPFPKTLIDALETGIPPSSGVAVGLNRLFLCWMKLGLHDDN